MAVVADPAEDAARSTEDDARSLLRLRWRHPRFGGFAV